MTGILPPGRLRRRTAVLLLILAGCESSRSRPLPETPAWVPRESAASRPAQEGPLNLAGALDLALANTPAIRAARARFEAAGAGIDVADTAYLPRVDFLWQELRATRNNVAGTTLPQSVVPPVSGPAQSDRSWESAWGSAAGMLISWEPFDFGLRSAGVELARLAARQAEVDIEVARLEAAAAAVEAFLAHQAARESLLAVQANVARWEVLAKAVRALADQQLRPGVDASRAEAEAAAARNVLIHAEQLVESSRLALAQALNLSVTAFEIDPGPLRELPRGVELPGGVPLNHAYLVRTSASLQTLQARRRALDSAGYPRANLQFALGGRGSGFDHTGETTDSDDGLYPDRANWAAGVTLTYSLMDHVQLGARRRAEEALERAELARGDQTYLELRIQNERVRSAYDASLKVAANLPLQLKAAQEAYAGAKARYDAGLGTLTEVSEGQRLLAQAEIDSSLARLTVWRTLAAFARAQGSFGAFLQTLARSGGK